MAYIQTTAPEKATGLLKQIYDAAIRRAGRLFNVLRLMSIHPRALQESMGLYFVLMHGPSKLSRSQREMIAVVTSTANQCHY